jgi:uncharacterized protein
MRRWNVLLVSVVLVILAGGAVMNDTNGDRARNRALVEDAFAAWRAGSGGPFDLLDDDASWTIVGRSSASKTYRTKRAFLREVIHPFNARMRQRFAPSVWRVYADGDTVIVYFEASGIALDDKPYANTYAWFLEMSGGRIRSARAFFDSVEFNELWTRLRPAAG